MIQWLINKVMKVREKRWLNIFTVILRILIGFAFLPAGLKKVSGQPFTDPANTGIFHEFVQIFHQTGFFYTFVGVLQLLAATLLMTQHFASLGAVLIFPILTAILVFCWSTMVIPTATVASLMFLGVVFLLLWDMHKWIGVFRPDGHTLSVDMTTPAPKTNMSLWSRCGWAIIILYFGAAALTGEVYRPKGPDWTNPNFIVLQVITLLPVLTFIIDHRQYRRKQG
jgi:uncharacterized membrane protein YphA (DoxX/SURF4 family)